MAVYLWEAHTRLGEQKSGAMEAGSIDDVNKKLRSQNLLPDKVKKKPIDIVIKMPGSSGVSTRDLVIFVRQFSTMIDAGLPLVQCLELLSGQADNPFLKNILVQVKSTVEEGATLADALSKHPKVFDTLFVNLVAAGEAGGVLDVILGRLAGYMEKNMKLVKQVKGAMTYPLIVMIAAFVVTVVLLVFVIPIFKNMFEDFGQALPAPTQFVMDLSSFVQGNIVMIFISMAAAYAGGRWILSTTWGRWGFDSFLLRAPIVGNVINKVAIAKFTRTMSTMLSSGVNILDALEIVRATAGNVVIEKGLRNVKEKISQGSTMAAPLAEVSVFPSMVVQMISVGEATGALDVMLSKIADFYDDEVDSAITTMVAMMEPLIMAGLAVVLGGLVVAMYLPVFTLAGSMA